MAVFTTISTETPEAESLISVWATTEDLDAAGQRRNTGVRNDFLLGRSALRALLNNVTGQRDWTLRPDPRGKLRGYMTSGIEGPTVSLSHTRGFVACAVSEENSIGIDVERWRTRDFAALAGYAFGPNERAVVARDGMAAFYRIWTLREAIAKATGNGLFAHLDGNDCMRASDGAAQRHGAWHFFYQMPEPDCSLAIAIENRNHGVQPLPIWTNVSTPAITGSSIFEKI